SFWRTLLAALLSLFGGPSTLPGWLVAIPLTLMGSMVIGGMVLLWVRGDRLIPLYLCSYVFLTCLTPWPDQVPRYLTPVTPFLALSFFGVLASVAGWRSRHPGGWERKASLVLTILLLAMIFFIQGLTLTHAYARGRRLVTYYDASGNAIRFPLFYHDARWEPV